MSVKQYTMLQRLEPVGGNDRHGSRFSVSDKRTCYVLGHRHHFARRQIRPQSKLWFDDKEKWQLSGSDLFSIHPITSPTASNLESEVYLSRTIRKELKLGREDAIAMKDKLFEEIDQMTRIRNAEPLSITEKEQLILAVIRTAKSLSKKALETK